MGVRGLSSQNSSFGGNLAGGGSDTPIPMPVRRGGNDYNTGRKIVAQESNELCRTIHREQGRAKREAIWPTRIRGCFRGRPPRRCTGGDSVAPLYRPVALVCRAVASRPASADGNNRVIGQVYQIYQLFHVGSEGLGRCQQQVGSGLEWIRILASRACHPLRCRRVRTDLKTLDVLFFFFSFSKQTTSGQVGYL